MEIISKKIKSIDSQWNEFITTGEGENDIWKWYPESLNRFKNFLGQNPVLDAVYGDVEPKSVVETKTMVENLKDLVGIQFSIEKWDSMTSSRIKSIESVTNNDVIALKEEILKERLWSCKYNW